MNTRVLLTVVALGIMFAAPRAHAQVSPLRAELLKDWNEQKAIMLKIADAMPAEKYWYKTTPAQRDYGQQILHVANGSMMYLRLMGARAQPPAIKGDATGKAEIMKALADAYDFGAAVINEQTDQSLLQIVDTNQDPVLSSRARVIYFLLGHTWDIYGQMAVYLRMNGITPPRSQRP